MIGLEYSTLVAPNSKLDLTSSIGKGVVTRGSRPCHVGDRGADVPLHQGGFVFENKKNNKKHSENADTSTSVTFDM